MMLVEGYKTIATRGLPDGRYPDQEFVWQIGQRSAGGRTEVMLPWKNHPHEIILESPEQAEYLDTLPQWLTKANLDCWVFVEERFVEPFVQLLEKHRSS